MNANMIFRLLMRFGPQLIAQLGKRRNTQQGDEPAQPGQPSAPRGQNLQQNARMMQRLMRMFRL